MQIYEELVARGLIAQVTNEEEIKKIEKACEKAVEYLKDNKMPYVSLIIKEDGIKVVQDQAFIPSNTKQS